jgi:hypothetical protein
MSEQKPLTITLPLSQFVQSHLGDGYWHSRTIDDGLARIIYELTKNHPDHGVYVQWADEHSPELEQPVLWTYSAWKAACDSWVRQKSLSDARIEEYNRHQANVRMLARAIMKHLEAIDEEHAPMVAANWIRRKNFGAMKLVGVNRLIQKGDVY